MRPSVLAFCLSASVFARAVACPSLAAQGTDDFFQARILPRDRSVNLQLSPANDAVEWQITPHGTPVPIKKEELLLTYSSFKVGYLHYNPLKVKLSASVKDFDDPAQVALQKLIDALMTTGSTISGVKSDTSAALLAAQHQTTTTDKNLANYDTQLKEMSTKIDSLSLSQDKNGKTKFSPQERERQREEAIAERVSLLVEQKAADAQAEQLAKHRHELNEIQAAIDDDSGAGAILKQVKSDMLEWPRKIDAAWGSSSTSGTYALEAGIQEMDVAKGKLAILARTLKGASKISTDASFTTGTEIRLLHRLDALIAQVGSSQKAVEDLMATLRDDELPSRWADPNQSIFVIGTLVEPTLSTGKEVTVSVIPLILDPTENGLKLTEQTPITATFKARRYRALMPEVGVGAVLGYIDRPKYGTALDDNGKTIVALSETDRVSIDPSIMVNFVCHCNAGGIAPMLQIGAATSKDLPAILLGGGFRLFGLGKGDIGIGGGLLLGWYKDLQKLKVGSAVGGTADIDADMGYITTPKPAPYISLQYKF